MAPTRIYIEILHNVNIVSLARNYPTFTSELFPLGANSDLRRNCTLHKNCPSGTSEFISFWRQLGSSLGVKIPGDSFSGIPLQFRWCLGISSFWRQLGSSLEFARGPHGYNPLGAKKEFIPRHQRKQRGILEKEYPGIFTPK